jgi:hypothetical protein
VVLSPHQVNRPSDWLFPGKQPHEQFDRQTVYNICRTVARRAQLQKIVSPAHAAAQLRHPFVGSRHRPAHHPGFAGPPQSAHHGVVHLHLPRQGGRDDQSSRPAPHNRGGGTDMRNAGQLEVTDVLRRDGSEFQETYVAPPHPSPTPLRHAEKNPLLRAEREPSPSLIPRTVTSGPPPAICFVSSVAR